MGLSFRKSIKLGPLRVNLSKSGIGTSIGVKGLRVGVDGKGRGYTSVGIPGTGIYGRSYAGRTTGSTTINTIADVQEQGFINGLGFNYNYDYYRESDSKGCLNIFAWGLGICLLAVPPLGITYLLILYFYQRKQNKEPKTLFRKSFASAFTNVTIREYHKALTFLATCGQLEPDNPDYLDLSGVCHYQMQQFESAANFFDRADKAKLDDTRIKVFLTDSLRHLERPEDNPRLLQLYSDIAKTNPEDDEIKFGMGYYLCIDKQYKEAIGALQKIRPDSEMYIRALNVIATCYSELKEYDKGIEVLKLAPLKQKQLDDELKLVHYNLGELYEVKGDKASALKHYNIIEIQDIDFMDVRARIEKLTSI